MNKEIKRPNECPECKSKYVKGDREKIWNAGEKQKYFWTCEDCGWKEYYSLDEEDES